MRASRFFSIETYYRVTWQLVIALAAALAVSAGVVRPLVGLPFFGLAFSLMTPFAGQVFQRRKRLTYAIGFTLFLLGVNETTRFSDLEMVVQAMIEIITGFLPLLLLNRDSPRAYWLAVLDASVIAVGSITFTTSVLVYIGFIAFTAVLLLNLNAANLYLPDRRGDRLREELPGKYFSQFMRVAPAGAASAAAIFLAFPRVQSFSMSLGALIGSHSRVGYSGAIELDGDGAIESSKSLAFLVEAKDKDWLRQGGADLLFRGDSLDSFDGVRWSTSVFHFKPKDRVADLRVATRLSGETHDLVVHMEPTPNAAIFYPEVLATINERGFGAGHLLVNSNGSVIRDSTGVERFEYTLKTLAPVAVSALPSEPLSALGAGAQEVDDATPADLGPKELEAYLAVPPGVRDAPWFKAWVAEVAVPPREPLRDFKARMYGYFGSHFAATLDNKFSGEDAFQSFLTKDRKGHCEYFATATALLLRTLGVPARVVVGYKGGTYNKLIDMLEVREENAHAWVEAFVPGAGWFALDPTPDAVGGAGDELISTLHIYANALSFWFRQYLVDYDAGTQQDLLRSFKQVEEKARSGQPFAWHDLLSVYGRPAALLGLVAILVVTLVRVRRHRLVEEQVPAYYRAFKERARVFGRTRRQGETYAAFHARLAAEARFAPELVNEIDRALERDLYSGAPLSLTEGRTLLQRVNSDG